MKSLKPRKVIEFVRVLADKKWYRLTGITFVALEWAGPTTTKVCTDNAFNG